MDMKRIGSFIQAMRKQQKMSQRELGEYLSVTDKAVSKWERGIACPDIELLKNMALLFHCNISDIINGCKRELQNSSFLIMDSMGENGISENFHEDVHADFDLNSTSCVSPLLFGDNLEHTRDCLNSGISAELLKNRKFAGKPGRLGCAMEWYPIGEKAYFFFSDSYTRHADDYRMIRRGECNSQAITNYHKERAGIGQKNIYLKEDTEYCFSIAAKVFSPTELTIQLLSEDGCIYDSQKLFLANTEFQEFSFTLFSDTADPNARLELTFDTAGTVWIGALSFMPSDHFHGMRPDVIEKMKELGIKLLRWPGGNFAGEYNWKDGLLPRNERAPFQSYLWLETQPHTMGYDFHDINIDDFIALCKKIGAEPFITINPAWNTPDESAQWVEYCNGDSSTPYGRLRIERGYEAPYNVQFWSLGNEFGYGHMEGPNLPSDYSRIVAKHAYAMTQVSPELSLCSSGPYPNQEWVNHSAKILSNIAPLVSLHHYAQYPEYVNPSTRKEEYCKFINKVHTEFFYRLKMLRELLGDSELKISFDEWNAWYAWYRGGSVTEGIMAASFLHMLIQNADAYGVAMACHFESVNEGSLLVYPDRVIMTPTGKALSLIQQHANGMICTLQQDFIATRKNDIITCTLLNRSYDQDKQFFMPKIGTPVSSTVYTSEDVVPHTAFEEKQLPFTESDDCIQLKLPAHSIACLQIKL